MTLTAHETAQRAWINGDPAAAALAELADLTDAGEFNADALNEAEEALKDAKAEIATLRQVMADVADRVSEAAEAESDPDLDCEGDLLMALEDAAAALRNALR